MSGVANAKCRVQTIEAGEQQEKNEKIVRKWRRKFEESMIERPENISNQTSDFQNHDETNKLLKQDIQELLIRYGIFGGFFRPSREL